MDLDPVGFQGGDTNLYAYAQSDPVNWVDPSGLKPGDFFPSEKDAARQALKDINAQSKTKPRVEQQDVQEGQQVLLHEAQENGQGRRHLQLHVQSRLPLRPTTTRTAPSTPGTARRSSRRMTGTAPWTTTSTDTSELPGRIQGRPQDKDSAGGINVWGDRNYGKL